MTRRSTRHTWQDERRVRRLAALLGSPQLAALKMTAADLDARAQDIETDRPKFWEDLNKLASHYLRELGRTRT